MPYSWNFDYHFLYLSLTIYVIADNNISKDTSNSIGGVFEIQANNLSLQDIL